LILLPQLILELPIELAKIHADRAADADRWDLPGVDEFSTAVHTELKILRSLGDGGRAAIRSISHHATSNDKAPSCFVNT